MEDLELRNFPENGACFVRNLMSGAFAIYAQSFFSTPTLPGMLFTRLPMFMKFVVLPQDVRRFEPCKGDLSGVL